MNAISGFRASLAVATLIVLTSCSSEQPTDSALPPLLPPRTPDAIIVAGQSVRTGAPVVTWLSPNGYDGYRESCFFRDDILPTRPAKGCDEPRRYGFRRPLGLPEDIAAQVLSLGFYDAPSLRKRVDQFVLHYDVCGCSRRCFEVLHDVRGLSVHFMLDLDGTIYQTLDAEARARHATIANDRSVGVEIAQIGAAPAKDPRSLDAWYRLSEGRHQVLLPKSLRDVKGVLHREDYVPTPARSQLLSGTINGQSYVQRDFTAAQYESLARLTRALASVLPGIALEVPRDSSGAVSSDVLSEEEFARFRGVLGHYHVQRNKADPGPAMAFEWVLERARSLPDPEELDPRDVVLATGPVQ